MTTRSPREACSPGPGGLAAVAVAFAAADTYVVVLRPAGHDGQLGHPDRRSCSGRPRSSPGFLLGYVAMLPLIGRIADLRGRVPVLVAALVVFALGSLVTALAYDMPSDGDRPVPARASAAAAWCRRPSRWSPTSAPRSRGIPLGMVSAVQEIGSVLGPLFGALVLAVADWRVIFADQPGRRAAARRRDPAVLGGVRARRRRASPEPPTRSCVAPPCSSLDWAASRGQRGARLRAAQPGRCAT